MSKTYSVKEIYYTIQGEGHHTGQAAVFLRFSGCNLWSGREEDRHKAICQFCDTNFWGTDGLHGGKYSAAELAKVCRELWPEGDTSRPYIVCTGGEPLLQLDVEMIAALHGQGFYIAIESNGTIQVPEGVDWVCISPKADADLVVTKGDELKLVHPQQGNDLDALEKLEFSHFSLQPLDDIDQEDNILKCISICKERPRWKLSLQMHKIVGIP